MNPEQRLELKHITVKVTTSGYFTKSGFAEKRDVRILKKQSNPWIIDMILEEDSDIFIGMFPEDGLWEVYPTMSQGYYDSYPEVDGWDIQKIRNNSEETHEN